MHFYLDLKGNLPKIKLWEFFYGEEEGHMLEQGGNILLIFPEGTRRPPGAEPRYKYGVVSLYSAMDVPCLPIALNSGLFWPRRSMRRYPGTIRVEVLDPIPPGLGKEAFFQRLQRDVEAATARLVAEGERELT